MHLVLPNILAPLIVQYSLKIAAAILSAAGLSFVGLGVQPPTPEWGAMLSAGRSLIRYNWWLTLFPGLAIMITVYGYPYTVIIIAKPGNNVSHQL